MLNEAGHSFMEALLASVIFFILSAIFVPMLINMEKELERQKIEANIAEAAYKGARLVLLTGQKNGKFTMDRMEYLWEYELNRICVTYYFEKERYEKCIEAD